MLLIPQLEELGFSIWETGGGCQAFGRSLSLDSYLYVTDEEGCDTPDENDEMIGLGHYPRSSGVSGFLRNFWHSSTS